MYAHMGMALPRCRARNDDKTVDRFRYSRGAYATLFTSSDSDQPAQACTTPCLRRYGLFREPSNPSQESIRANARPAVRGVSRATRASAIFQVKLQTCPIRAHPAISKRFDVMMLLPVTELLRSELAQQLESRICQPNFSSFSHHHHHHHYQQRRTGLDTLLGT